MTNYSRMSLYVAMRCYELFGHAWPCDGDTLTTDCPEEAQDATVH